MNIKHKRSISCFLKDGEDINFDFDNASGNIKIKVVQNVRGAFVVSIEFEVVERL